MHRSATETLLNLIGARNRRISRLPCSCSADALDHNIRWLRRRAAWRKFAPRWDHS